MTDDGWYQFFSFETGLYEMKWGKKFSLHETVSVRIDGVLNGFWSGPLWFRELLHQAQEEYFANQSIRTMLSEKTRTLESIIFSISLLDPNAGGNWILTTEGSISIPTVSSAFLKPLRSLLLKEGYELLEAERFKDSIILKVSALDLYRATK